MIVYRACASAELRVPTLCASVGVGTGYRPYPTKNALTRAIIDDRTRSLIAAGRAVFDEAERLVGLVIDRILSPTW